MAPKAKKSYIEWLHDDHEYGTQRAKMGDLLLSTEHG